MTSSNAVCRPVGANPSWPGAGPSQPVVGLGLVPDQLGVSLHAGVFSAVFPDTGEVDSGRSAMPCGQGAGAITDELSCAAIIERVMREAEETIERLAGLRG